MPRSTLTRNSTCQQSSKEFSTKLLSRHCVHAPLIWPCAYRIITSIGEFYQFIENINWYCALAACETWMNSLIKWWTHLFMRQNFVTASVKNIYRPLDRTETSLIRFYQLKFLLTWQSLCSVSAVHTNSSIECTAGGKAICREQAAFSLLRFPPLKISSNIYSGTMTYSVFQFCFQPRSESPTITKII